MVISWRDGLNGPKYKNVAERVYHSYKKYLQEFFVWYVKPCLDKSVSILPVQMIIFEYLLLSMEQHFVTVMQLSPCIFRFVSIHNKHSLGVLCSTNFAPRIYVNFEPMLTSTLNFFNDDLILMQQQVARIAGEQFEQQWKIRNAACIATKFKQNAEIFQCKCLYRRMLF